MLFWQIRDWGGAQYLALYILPEVSGAFLARESVNTQLALESKNL